LIQELDAAKCVRVETLVMIYRTHEPSLFPFGDVLPALIQLREAGVRTGLVTDGNATVQFNKIHALNLRPHLDALTCTDVLGREHWKPSRVPFDVVLDLLDVNPREAAYVGDDPRKDFIAPNAMGMLSVCLSCDGQNLAQGVGDVPGPARADETVGSIAEAVDVCLRYSQ